jgi:PEP-CTERM motif
VRLLSGVQLSKGLFAVAALAAACVAGSASAAEIATYTISDGTFGDGGSFSGWAAENLTTDAYTWDIVTTSGATLSGVEYTSATGSIDPPVFVQEISPDLYGELLLELSPSSPSAGTVSAEEATADCLGCDVIATRYSTGGVYTFGISGVPEPASWALMIVGVGLAGAQLRHRRRSLSGDGRSLA